ncbi:MAG TPA: DUF1761 domain-containing protein [Thermoanaerobaculia bacterium]|jgi:hypothetical protein|nr:DUF1761 domain-containing protein [Thermoanaerobaculia bacterium]
MPLPELNYLAILVSGIVIFILGGLWYSVLFGRPWMALMGKTEEELKANAAGPASYAIVFLCGLITAFALAIVIQQFAPVTIERGLMVAALCWAGFAGVTSFGTSLFSAQPRMLWLINSGYNLVSFLAAGAILSAWR